jgi:hypothetical protein
MVTDQPHHQSYALFRAGAAVRFRVPVHGRTALTAIRGRRRVEAVELTDLRTGATREVDCDLVVFTGDWIPEQELAILGDVPLDRGTLGPAVDAGLRTARPGVFAAGNVLHGAETADIAALSGRHVAAAVTAYLGNGAWPAARVPVVCEAPLRWLAPNVVTARGPGPSRGRFLLRAREELLWPLIELSQDGRQLLRRRLPRVMSARSAALPPGWASDVDAAGGPVVARVRSARRRGRSGPAATNAP